MFEDTKEPEDMFDATDKVAPQVTAPTQLSSADLSEGDLESRQAFVTSSLSKDPAQLDSIASISEKRGGFPWKVMVLVVGVIVVIGAAFLLWMKIVGFNIPVASEQSGEGEEVKEVEEVEEVKEVEEVEEVKEVEEGDKKEEVSRKDTDKDGLTDEEEKEFGTSISASDTDSDGLFDPEEIKTWETDPLNPDTDGDGFLDGEEVNAGYNPNGEGLLREAPTESG